MRRGFAIPSSRKRPECHYIALLAKTLYLLVVISKGVLHQSEEKSVAMNYFFYREKCPDCGGNSGGQGAWATAVYCKRSQYSAHEDW